MKKIILIFVAVIATIGCFGLYHVINPPSELGHWQHIGPGEYIKDGYVRTLPPKEMMRYMSCATGDTVAWSPIQQMAWAEKTFRYTLETGGDGDTCIRVILCENLGVNEMIEHHGLVCWPDDAINLDTNGRIIK